MPQTMRAAADKRGIQCCAQAKFDAPTRDDRVAPAEQSACPMLRTLRSPSSASGSVASASQAALLPL